MKTVKKFIILIIFIAGFLRPDFLLAATLTERLAGRILLQVESSGEAWYLYPVNSERYYLGRPDDAFRIMRELGLGISERDFSSWGLYAPNRLSGRIVLRVESRGEAYYINPLNLRLHYLGRPADAFRVMRELGLGITNADLDRITPAPLAPVPQTAPIASTGTNYSFSWTYRLQPYSVGLNLNKSLYDRYASAPKVYSYYGKQPSDWEEQYYQMFLNGLAGDTTIQTLVDNLTKNKGTMSNDQFVSYALAMVQFISYETARGERILAGEDELPRYPYETLYLKTGVCSDKTFLAYRIAERLGFGVAVLAFPDHLHSALGIACPIDDSINGSGYCYVETTSYFPIGVIPRNFSGGQASTGVASEYFSSLFDPTNLGAIKITNKKSGKLYTGVAGTKAEINNLINTDRQIEEERIAMQNEIARINAMYVALTAKHDELMALRDSGQISAYNAMVAEYNQMVQDHAVAQKNYNDRVIRFNASVENYNYKQKVLFQK